MAAVVPIPVTVKIDNVKVIRREKEEEEESQENRKENSGVQNAPADSDLPVINKSQEEYTGGLGLDDY